MKKTIHSKRYEIFCGLLAEARTVAGFTQAQVARKLGKPQSFVSKVESGERRLDVVEFLEIAEILDIDASAFIKKI